MTERTAAGVLLMALACACAGCNARASVDPPVDFDSPEVVKIVESIRSRGDAGSDTGSGEAAATTGEGWGALKGKFTYAGDAPAIAYIPTAGKDADMCGDRVPDQSLMVDPTTKGIANVVVFARRVSRKKDPETPAASPVFDQKNCLFLTQVFPIRTGQEFKVLNSDTKAHNTAINATGDLNSNPLIPGGGTVSVTFKKVQNAPIPVTCSIHPWMKAYMFPRGDSYVAVSNKDGDFEIKDLPAGEEIEFMAWHERVGGSGGGLAAKSGWNGGRFKLKIPMDGVEDLGEIHVPPTAFK